MKVPPKITILKKQGYGGGGNPGLLADSVGKDILVANKDNAQMVDNGSTEVSKSSDSNSSRVIKSDATKSDIVRDKTTIDDNSRTKVPEFTAQANNKQALTTVTEDNGAKVSKTEKYSNSDIKNQSKNSEKTPETTLVKKVLGKEKSSSENLIDQKNLDGKIEISATDPSNYPTELNGLIGKDKYIYQVLSLDGDSGSKLILSVNRNNHNDTNIYAYVTDGNVNYERVVPIGMYSIITVDGRKYWLDNNGSSEVSINGNKVSTQNSSTVTSEPRDSDNNPISQDYGLGNISDGECSAIGEIVPVFTKNSVIKYYYRDNEGHLQEFKNSELPNVSVEGFTGQKFEIDNVDQYKRVIQGYYLTSDNLPTGDFKGTLSQFNGDKYYKKVYYDFDTGRVENSVVYHQISPDGTMEVWLVDGNGSPITERRVIEPNTSTKFKRYIGYGLYGHYEYTTVRNPYVTAAPHEAQFIYKKLGSIIPVDENRKQIGDAIQFKNNPNDPTRAWGKVPSISGYTPKYRKVDDTVDPTNPGKNIQVIYSANPQTATITYIDDTENKTLVNDTQNGKFNQAITFEHDPADVIKGLEEKGYKLVSNDFNSNKYQADDSKNVFYVHFAHGTKKVSREHSASFTVHYIYKDGRQAKPDHEQTISFTETGVKDKVTGKIAWTSAAPQKFDDVATPAISGYTPDKDNVAGSTVRFGDKDIEVTVTYHNNAQTAKITYIDDTEKKTLGSDKQNGKFNQAIIFEHDPAEVIKGLEEKGYKLVSDNFKPGIKYQADNSNNVFYVHLRHGIVPVTPDTDHNDVPKNTVKEAQPDQLTKEVDLTVQYVNSDGTKFTGKLPENGNQRVTFTGTAYVDKVTGKLVNAQKQVDGTWVVDDSKTDKPQVIWKADGKDSFDKVISPVENDYHLTDIDSHRKGNNVEEITGLTQDSGSITVTVTYTKNGKIIPVDKDGNQITGADQPVFPTDPNDPSRVDSGKIPDLSDKGYHPLDKAVKPDGTVDPDSEDPSKDIEVEYVKSGTISVKYHDNTEDKDIDGYGKNASGNEDAPFNYDPTSDLAELKGKGYVLDGKEPEIPRQFTASAKEVIINLKHGTTTVTSNNPGHPGEPVDPKNSEGPKYPNGTELDQVKRTGIQTIHYVGAGDKTPADNKQTFIFTREITFDNVTGKIISKTPWNVQSHTFGNVDTPVIPGYHADKAVAGGETVTPDDLNKVITVTYAPDVNPGNPSDHGDIPSPEPTPEPETTPNPTPDDQPDSEISSDEHFENVKPKDKLDKTNPKKVDAYKKQRNIIKTKIAKQGHTEIAEPIEDKVTRENNVKVVSDPVENTAAEPKLPQTGEADNSIIGLLGMLLASFAAMFGFDSLHSHDKKQKN